ncbi:hypothetical protein AB3331_09390 [Streptococcus sp. H49]|uniref:hypothetical protein n=1 Tax=Streptococcus huangxiaojuni TaxID=3237239 RepID=UPI0034A29835
MIRVRAPVKEVNVKNRGSRLYQRMKQQDKGEMSDSGLEWLFYFVLVPIVFLLVCIFLGLLFEFLYWLELNGFDGLLKAVIDFLE